MMNSKPKTAYFNGMQPRAFPASPQATLESSGTAFLTGVAKKSGYIPPDFPSKIHFPAAPEKIIFPPP